MKFNTPSRLLLTMSSLGLLLSCETATPGLQPSYTEVLAVEVAKQKASDCDLFRPAPIPEDAPLAWREHAERFGAKWRDYCVA